MLVIEVDDLDPEPLQARLAGRPHVIRPPAHAPEAAVLAADVAELGGEEHPVAAVGDGPADQLLVAADAVHVGGVEEVDAALDRLVDRRDRFGFVAGAVEFGHAHAAEADRRHFRAAAPRAACVGS